MNQLFIKTEVDANIREHKVSHYFPIDIESTLRLRKGRATFCWRQRK
jgi:hypothetical protein